MPSESTRAAGHQDVISTAEHTHTDMQPSIAYSAALYSGCCPSDVSAATFTAEISDIQA